MKRNILISASLFSSVLPLIGKTPENTSRPNVILIYTDQQRYDTIEGLGNGAIETPNLNRLVRLGTSYTNHHVATPVSVASRWSLHSGMYSSSHGAFSNHHQVVSPPKTSLPEELRKAGYYTAILGKNHCFLNKQRVDYIKSAKNAPYGPADKRSADSAAKWDYRDDPMHILTNNAIDLIDKSAQGTKPLFLWLSYLYPHTPFMAPEPYFSKYKDKKLPGPIVEPDGLKIAQKPFRQQFHQSNNSKFLPYDKVKTERMKRTYYSMISMIDDEIGRLINHLEQNKLLENTIIIFSSDHGDYMGDHGLYTKSPALYDCLTHTPLIFVYKGVVKEDRRDDSMVSSTSIMPTILDLVGIDIPEQVQGVSLKKSLYGKKQRCGKYVFAEYGIPGTPFTQESYDNISSQLPKFGIDFANGIPWEGNPISLAGRIRMIRSDSFKLIEEVGGCNELYDIRNDKGELINLYGNHKYSRVQKQLHRELDKWKSSIPMVMNDSIELGAKDIVRLKKRVAL